MINCGGGTKEGEISVNFSQGFYYSVKIILHSKMLYLEINLEIVLILFYFVFLVFAFWSMEEVSWYVLSETDGLKIENCICSVCGRLLGNSRVQALIQYTFPFRKQSSLLGV